MRRLFQQHPLKAAEEATPGPGSGVGRVLPSAGAKFLFGRVWLIGYVYAARCSRSLAYVSIRISRARSSRTKLTRLRSRISIRFPVLGWHDHFDFADEEDI